jgi:hypothetical protein
MRFAFTWNGHLELLPERNFVFDFLWQGVSGRHESRRRGRASVVQFISGSFYCYVRSLSRDSVSVLGLCSTWLRWRHACWAWWERSDGGPGITVRALLALSRV